MTDAFKKMHVVEIYGDCGAPLLVKVIQTGAACHTGNRTCFLIR